MMVIFVANRVDRERRRTVYSSMRTTRRTATRERAATADAAVNDAVKTFPARSDPTCRPGQNSSAPRHYAGSYTYSATLDPAAPIWHIDAVGVDNSGVKRHVKAKRRRRASSAMRSSSTRGLRCHRLLGQLHRRLEPAGDLHPQGGSRNERPANLTFRQRRERQRAAECTDAVWFGDRVFGFESVVYGVRAMVGCRIARSTSGALVVVVADAPVDGYPLVELPNHTRRCSSAARAVPPFDWT